MSSKGRILMARFALDGHDRGLVALMRRSRDAGWEAIYIHYTDPKQVAKVALEEDVDVIGLSSSMGEHFYVTSGVLQALKDTQLDTPLILGGVIPTVDEPRLLKMGAKGVFGPGSSPDEALALMAELVSQRGKSGA